MAKEFAKAFYRSKLWKQCRLSYIAYRVSVDGGLCEVCHDKTGYIVHHIKQLTSQNINNPDIALTFDNLRFDCKDCHDLEPQHWKDKIPRA